HRNAWASDGETHLPGRRAPSSSLGNCQRIGRRQTAMSAFRESVTVAFSLGISRRRIGWTRVVLATLALLGTRLQAQSFSVASFVIASGGGVSGNTSAGYEVSGAIGQFDAGRMAGGSFLVDGGFWNVAPTAPPADGPSLSVAQAGGILELSWDSAG